MSRKSGRGSNLASSIPENPLSQKSPDHRKPDKKTKLTNLQNVLDDFNNLAIERKPGTKKSKDLKPRRNHTTPERTKHDKKPEPPKERQDDTSKSEKVGAGKENNEKHIRKGQSNARRSQKIEKKVMDWKIENYPNMVEVKKEPSAEFSSSVPIKQEANSSFEDNNIDEKTVLSTGNMRTENRKSITPIKTSSEGTGENARKKTVSRKSVTPKGQLANDKNSNTNLLSASSDSKRKSQVKRSTSGDIEITKPATDNLDPSKTKVKSKSGSKPSSKISHPPKINGHKGIAAKELRKFEKELHRQPEKMVNDRKIIRREKRVARAMETLSHEVMNIMKEMGYLSQSSSTDSYSDESSGSSSSCSCSCSCSCADSYSCSCSCSSSSCSCGSYTSESSYSDSNTEYTLCSCSDCRSCSCSDKSDSESDSTGTESS